jgi:hypothetical protein
MGDPATLNTAFWSAQGGGMVAKPSGITIRFPHEHAYWLGKLLKSNWPRAVPLNPSS